MRIACGRVYKYAVPGQFVMVRSPGQTAPLLSRPFSIHDVIIEESGAVSVDILYKIVGTGTLKLSQKNSGDQIDVLGPLGRGFSTRGDYQHVYLVAGGIGIAPFVFLGKHLMRQGLQSDQITLFIGGQSSGDLLCLGIFEGLGLDLQLTTDDGSSGQQSLVTAPLEAAFAKTKPDIIYACGPIPMLREVMKLSRQHKLPCQVSIETMMACGMGACLGCAVEQAKANNTYLHACKDGPVFDASRIVL
jgi:dihydroorotate dehydrogenase electron transfer subunit